MFADAVERAARYTRPYVALRRKHDGTVFSAIGAFVLINEEGWLLTAAHMVGEIARARASVQGGHRLAERIASLEASDNAADQKEADALRAEIGGHLAQSTEIWAVPGFRESKPVVVEQHVLPEADLALVRVEPFDSDESVEFPVFRPADEPVRPGMSVARVGYPFHEVKAEYDPTRSSFDIVSGFPVPQFASDGIVSRFKAVRTKDGREYSFIETSTPGLRGQSGGPLVDVEGRMCGLQSRTVHYDLGFDAHVERGGERTTERQFLNVGEAAHVDVVREFLADSGVACYGP
jgi:S1-C subfamily serine protease